MVLDDLSIGVNEDVVVFVQALVLMEEVLGSVHECKFIWGGCVVELLTFLFLNDDCVAEGQVDEHTFDHVVVGVFFVTHVLFEEVVSEVEVSYVSLSSVLAVALVRAVGELANAHFLEVHLVASERTSFIRKDVVNQAKLLIEVSVDIRGSIFAF